MKNKTLPIPTNQNTTMKSQDSKSLQNQTAPHFPLLNNPTINQQIRNRMLFKDADGTPFSKVYAKQVFAPANMHEARRTIIGKFEKIQDSEPYDISRALSKDDKLMSK